MKIAISGSNGYIGGKLIKELENKEFSVVRIKREFLGETGELMPLIAGSDVVINLAGAPIFTRWTNKNKEIISKSRVQSTENIVEAINRLTPETRPKLFISASAIGIYEPDILHTESNNSLGNNFVSTVAKNWENATLGLSHDVRKVIFRIGLVLGKDAKTISNLLPLFKLCLGGKLGQGNQPFPFIHIDDVVRAIFWVIANKQAEGIYNLVTPQQINNKQFTRAMAKIVKRPAIFTVPEIALRVFLGEASSLLLQNPQVYPEQLINQGFTFKFQDIESCLKQIIKRNNLLSYF